MSTCFGVSSCTGMWIIRRRLSRDVRPFVDSTVRGIRVMSTLILPALPRNLDDVISNNYIETWHYTSLVHQRKKEKIIPVNR